MKQDLQKLDEIFFTKFSSTQFFKKNHQILWPGVVPPGVFYVKSGYVRQYLIFNNGKELTVNILKPETYFPMIWAINNITNIYFYECLTDVTLIKAPRAAMMKQLESNPQLLYDLTKRTLSGLDGISKMMASIVTGSAYQQISSVILVLARRLGKPHNKTHIIIKVPLTHRIIGTLAGLSRETTSLELERLTKNKTISKKNRFLVINDIEKLEKESQLGMVDSDII